ncbi:PTS cellobiose transporter subunit IIC [Pseudolactococcus paracarnosus]|uniref:Permease IIC component n=1 Tax=Pseudolactococcus paracarnosus TaxID=2749962 RepID=A0A7L4WER0_9LACT|nr:PTS cellobiose transporter subunit IIC [Lactococcus paracarnosus]SPC35194.1 Lichenan permease IIC component LicC [Lactococcus piscium]MCJ1978000.1 PTS cellobiose transporter subunit IIC [Lactococcus paracarnosus]MCJ1984168.1 PTS cellobiose transporter subunit IIC [Lactococcus paracarnosus]MCJ1994294.1 PTS cellobiose transporter subunit IIC [Lactococcus paracarnosus]MCJ1998285.1 PTS cellobiose transporter subunit IIC [Lactococcus paracarnosus]
MKKGFALLEKYLMGPMSKLATYRPVRAIMAAGLASIPFTIVGSMFLVFNIIPLAFSGLTGLFTDTFFKYTDLYMLANKCTMGILSLYFAIVIGYEYTKIYEEEGVAVNPLNGALLSVAAFFMCIPELVYKNGAFTVLQTVTDSAKVINGWRVGGSSLDRLGTAGIFTAIIMGSLAVNLYVFCVKKNLVIKMPDAVPPGVSRSFTALIPAFVITIVTLAINGVLVALGTDIFNMISIPFGFVTNLTNSWLGMCVILFFIHALWIVGIHGANIIGAFITPITLANLETNIAGGRIPFAGEFTNSFVIMGGSGATLGLCLYLVFLAKSEQLKILGKASIVPSIFNINEPLIFGIPIVYNPYLAIPFFLAPIGAGSIAYWAIKLQFVKPIIAQVPWPSPIGLGAFIGTAGDVRAIFLALITFFVAFAIYLPFIKFYDIKLVKEEQETLKAAKKAA